MKSEKATESNPPPLSLARPVNTLISSRWLAAKATVAAPIREAGENATPLPVGLATSVEALQVAVVKVAIANRLETVKAESGVGLEIVHAEPTEKIRKSNCPRACVTKSLWVVLTTI